MNIKSFFSRKKLLLINIFLSIYIIINLIGGDRGLVSYIEKKNLKIELAVIENNLVSNLMEFEKKNSLLSEKINFDYLDILYREKFKFGKKEEFIIKLK
ncbi:MAG: septation ring formation regulator EzrA [Candidatus Pelagibacter sp.]|nr:septation ring formation regulator EzrA [Candidatus Pelagibacter sp.]|tara:strand:+ start:139 stop:435 length:297 start_codon:yes stop_codon:yes gene_type:complete